MQTHRSRTALAFACALLVAGSPAVQAASRGARTSVNGGSTNVNVNRNANVNKNANVNVNRNANVNVNRNVNVNVHHDVDVHHSYHGGCCYHDDYHPVATAAAVVLTAAVIGSVVHSLPPSCTVVIVNGITYQQCGSTWYQPQFVGTTTTYVVVVAPR